MKADSKVVRI